MKTLLFLFFLAAWCILRRFDPKSVQFVKPGVSPEEYVKDLNDCFGRIYEPGKPIKRGRLEACMKEKGYFFLYEKPIDKRKEMVWH